MTEQVVDNLAMSRFELAVGEHVAFATYRREPGRLIIPYVEAPAALRGAGVAGRLLEGVLATARDQELKIVPLCSYARAYIQRRPEHFDLLAQS